MGEVVCGRCLPTSQYRTQITGLEQPRGAKSATGGSRTGPKPSVAHREVLTACRAAPGSSELGSEALGRPNPV